MKLPFNFRRAAEGKDQLASAPSIEPMVWNDNVPRKAISEDGVNLVVYIPRLVKSAGVVCILSCTEILTDINLIG